MKNNFTEALKKLTGFDGLSDQSEETEIKDEPLEESTEVFVDAKQEELLEILPLQPFYNAPSEHITQISKSMVIMGDIDTNDDVCVQGEIIGNVITTANIHGSNMILGNVSAQNMKSDTMRLKGNIKIGQDLFIGENSVVVGDITAGNLVVAGKVKGNCDVRESTHLTKGAYLVGDVCADDFSTEQGAKLQGKVIPKTAAEELETDFDFGGEL
ncbi:MAG: hypothetical protein DBY08_03680 [Clostridiales bacterium]|nr:MAG: hypothetical protein DBY08_03680 [Clostridiales bacterium]